MIVRAMLAAMRMIVRGPRFVQSIVGVAVAMDMLMRMSVRVRMSMAVRMGVHDIAMPVFVGMNMSMRVLMNMLVGMAVRMVVRVTVIGVVHGKASLKCGHREIVKAFKNDRGHSLSRPSRSSDVTGTGSSRSRSIKR